MRQGVILWGLKTSKANIMSCWMKQIFEESKITAFVKNFNRKTLIYFYDSASHLILNNISRFGNEVISKNTNGSFIIKAISSLKKCFALYDLGWFIVFTVLSHTAIMIALGKSMGMVSIFVRCYFLILGIIFVCQKSKKHGKRV